MTEKSMKVKLNSRESRIGELCIANISPRERQIRSRFGIIQLAIGLVILAVLILSEVNPLWRLPLLFVFGAAASGYFQAKDKT